MINKADRRCSWEDLEEDRQMLLYLVEKGMDINAAPYVCLIYLYHINSLNHILN